MDTKPRNTKILKMKENDVKIKLDSTGNVTDKQVEFNWRILRVKHIKVNTFSLEYQIYVYIYILICTLYICVCACLCIYILMSAIKLALCTLSELPVKCNRRM